MRTTYHFPPIFNLIHQWMCFRKFSKHTYFLIGVVLLFCLYNVYGFGGKLLIAIVNAVI